MKRFSIKTLLIGGAIVALVIYAYPKVQRYARWNDMRNKLVAWSAKLDRESETVESYCHVDLRFVPSRSSSVHAGRSYSVLTGEPRKTVNEDGQMNWVIESETRPDPYRFFVIPPGKWVNDIDEVIEAWDRYSENAGACNE